jgi:hypothetical protein
LEHIIQEHLMGGKMVREFVFAENPLKWLFALDIKFAPSQIAPVIRENYGATCH